MKKYLSNLQHDLPASIVVFLVALPLCLGIALASDAPLASGLIAGIIGGLVIGSVSGSHTSVSGPAAGLALIVATAIADLGSFEVFLVAVVLGGIIQFGFGMVKAGVVGKFFPISVIKGMLAAIGLIIFLKQLPHIAGFDMEAFGDMSFEDQEGHNTFTNIKYAFSHITPGAFIIGGISLAILILWEWLSSRSKVMKFIPGALVVVILGVVINLIYQGAAPHLVVGQDHLVNIPPLMDDSGGTSFFAFPDFSAITNPVVWKTAFVIALIASLETLLSVEAVDKLDPERRSTPKNRELVAQGIGNTISGLIGGLPITAVIVRSSANVNSGAKTKLSAIIHGIFLVIAVAVIPFLINMIPLASLAAVLIIVGYKLAKPSLWIQQFKLGWNQFIPFATTVVAVLLTDLLVGILIGIGVGLFFLFLKYAKTPYYSFEKEEYDKQGRKLYTLKLSEHVTFLHKASIFNVLQKVPNGAHVVIDGTRTKTLDRDVEEVLHEFVESAKYKDIFVEFYDVNGFDDAILKDTVKQEPELVEA